MMTTRRLLLAMLLCNMTVSLLSATAIALDTVPITQYFGMPTTTWEPTHIQSPAEQIPLMEAPVPTFNGNAQLAFPIRIPDGRKAHHPDLSITYNNEGGKSWIGNDWDLSLSMISVDTRWGVPRYSDVEESEIYLLDGEQMGPVFHRAVVFDREAERSFYLRQDLQLQRITRHGNHPSNYWWEVRSPDGGIDYYGGSPSAGLSLDHTLIDDDGNVVQWQIHSSLDIHDNLISYQYQKVGAFRGENIYPQSISYNGFKEEEGPYRIDFKLSIGDARQDADINYRTGKKIVTDDLLAGIDVWYEQQLIRSYQLHYTEGQFGLKLLQKIEAYGTDGSFFYDYEFDYYDDLVQGDDFIAYGDTVIWEVPKDNLPVGSISGNIPGFASKPTILGGATTDAKGGGVAITVGPPFNPASKDFSAGPNGTLFDSSSEGVTALVDIDGDGMADKVWKEDGGLYYRSNLLASSGRAAFGPRTAIIGVESFSASRSSGWTVGAELTAPPVFGAYFHEETESTTDTYFADFNGDELLDIASKGTVYFNVLDDQGRPTFSTSSTDTPSPIIKGDDVVNAPPTAAELAELAERNPLHDVIRSWEAPYSGTVVINGGPRLIEDTSIEAVDYELADGVQCYVQYQNALVFAQSIAAGDFSQYDIADLEVEVTSGQQIYFRVSSVDDGLYDEVDWAPSISYVGSSLDYEDENRLSYVDFDAEGDYLLTSVRDVYVPVSGVASIDGRWQSPPLSDTVFVQFSGAVDTTLLVPPWMEMDTIIGLDTVALSADARLKITMWSKSNVDWAAIDWQPAVTYRSHDDGTPTVDANGNPLYPICPDIDKAFYKASTIEPAHIVQQAGMLSIETIELLQVGVGEKYATITIRGSRDTVFRLGQTVDLATDQMTYSGGALVELGDSVWYHFALPDGLSFLSNFTQSVAMIDGQVVDLMPSLIYRPQDIDRSQGPQYRGWGQFGYKPAGDLLPLIVLPEAGIDTTGLAGDTSLVDPNTGTGDLEGSNANLDDKFIILSPDTKLSVWRGSDVLTYVGPRRISSTRYGRKNLSQAQLGEGLTAPELVIKTSGDGGFGGLGIGPAEGSLGFTGVRTWAETDIADFNGDRYPDLLREDVIQYTNFRGGISPLEVDHGHGIHEVYSAAVAGGLGRNPATSSAKNAGGSVGKASNKSTARTKSRGRSNMNKSKSANKSARSSVGVNGNLSTDRDTAYHTFFDINGDGLEDKVWRDGRVALGRGYSFEAPRDWDFVGIGAGRSIDGGAGVGVSISNGSWQSGVSATRTTNYSSIAWADVNDDALIDQIVSVDPLMVRINTGELLLPAVPWLDVDALDSGIAVGESINTAFTFCLEFLFFRVCVNPSAFAGQGTSATTVVLQDINGDGYADFLFADGDDANLSALNSTVGRTNFLKSVQLPLGGEYSLDYDYRGNTYGLPFSKWVLTSVVIEDGVTMDGPAATTKKYDYAAGHYDRHERQFLGFGTVEEYHLSSDGDTLRSIVSTYDVDKVYTKGLIQSIAIADQEGRIMRLTDYDYSLVSPEDGSTLPPAVVAQDDAHIYPALTSIVERLYDESGNSMTQHKYYEYSPYGDVTRLRQVDEGNDVVEYIYDYSTDLDRYFTSNLTAETIIDNGVQIRHTDYVRDDRGNALETRRWIDDQSTAVTHSTYDVYSNVLMMTKPATTEGERLSMAYTYDEDLHQFLTKEIDGYGLVKNYEYDPIWQKVVGYEDENQNRTITAFDAYGRVQEVLTPPVLEQGLPFAIQYSYHLDAEEPHVLHTYYNEGQDIEVTHYTDGLHRSIQQQRSYEFVDGPGYIVSGWKIFDDLQRYSTYHHPSQSQGSAVRLDTRIDATRPDRETYDVLDRTMTFTDTEGARTLVSYTIETLNGRKVQEEKITNSLGHTRSNYRDYKGNLLTTRHDGPQGDIWTHYTYDGINQLVSVTDAQGHVSRYTYDGLGARLTIETPEGGLTTLHYDAARNLNAKSTSTIRATVNDDESVRYTYDKERLIGIDYPKYFQNRVELHYGTDQDSFNRKGRVWLLQDATGGRELFFDHAGRIVKEIRTLLINRSLTQTFVTTYDYDMWGRLLRITYPDGETVNHTYNLGGELDVISSSRDGQSYEIVNGATYDKYLDRRTIDLGNDIVVQDDYDDKGRLSKISIEGHAIAMSREMTYDALDNLLAETVSQGSDGVSSALDRLSTYDSAHRQVSSTARWAADTDRTYDQFFDYNDLHNLTLRSQEIAVDGELDPRRSTVYDYDYGNSDQPTRPSEFGGRTIDYDGNSNALLISSAAIFDYDQHIYDEENRMAGASNNGYKSRYTYDALGHRVIKSHGSEQGLFVNGAPAGFIEHTTNYRVEASPYLTFTDGGFYKHYYHGGDRILTKRGTGRFVTTLSDGPDITAGGIDYKQRIQAYEAAINQYYADLSAPPGPPTLLAISVQPEINGTGLPSNQSTGDFLPPPNWPNLMPPDTTGPPGPPIFYENAGLTRDNVKAGFNHVDGSITKELIQNFYHYDVHGNVVMMTDFAGELVQQMEYLPTGEVWHSDQVAPPLMQYAYGGMTLDVETGYYNVGDTYYDPATSLTFSADHVLQTYGATTVQRRVEGDFFYEYAETAIGADFDDEILNSERPDALVSTAINDIDSDDHQPEDPKVWKWRSKAKKQYDNAREAKANLNAEFKDVFQSPFENQEPSNPKAFFIDDFGSFAKLKLEENKDMKKKKRQADKRKMRQRTKRKVRFK